MCTMFVLNNLGTYILNTYVTVICKYFYYIDNVDKLSKSSHKKSKI